MKKLLILAVLALAPIALQGKAEDVVDTDVVDTCECQTNPPCQLGSDGKGYDCCGNLCNIEESGSKIEESGSKPVSTRGSFPSFM